MTDGQQFLIGRMVHYNNPITANDRFFTGDLNVVLNGFSGPPTLNFPWLLDETPNSGTTCCNDLLDFTSQISDITLTQGGLTFRLIISGFVPVANATDLPGHVDGHADERVLDRRGRTDPRLSLRKDRPAPVADHHQADHSGR